MKRFTPEEIWVDAAEAETPIARTVRQRASGAIVRLVAKDEPDSAGDFAHAKRRLRLRRHHGQFLRHCPAGTTGLVCCNYLVVNLGSNCPMDCSYCFLQEYLSNNPGLQVFTNPEDALGEIAAVVDAHPGRSFRIGTGEVVDSLALDPWTGLSRHLVPFFAERPNATLELKTKTDCVEDLLALDPKGRVVVSWSVNAPEICAVEEHGTASLTERIEAAYRVQEAGYRLGFHFDPLIEHDGWEEGYSLAVERIFSRVDPDAVAWISLGTLRLSPGLMQAVRGRPARTPVLGAELVPGADGKSRVWRGLRLRMYEHLNRQLRRVRPDMPIYLCMEPPSVWDRVMGGTPTDRELGVRLASGAAW